MTKIAVILVFSLGAFAQAPQSGQRTNKPKIPAPSESTPVQPAQDIIIHLSSELATAIEKHRRDTWKAVSDPKTGITQLQPISPTPADFLWYVLSSDGGYFQQLLQRYPPEAVKAKQEALKRATDDAKAAADEALKPK